MEGAQASSIAAEEVTFALAGVAEVVVGLKSANRCSEHAGLGGGRERQETTTHERDFTIT